MLEMNCKTCLKGFSTYKKWTDHLFTTGHQRNAENVIQGWSKYFRNRAVIFSHFCGAPNEEIQKDDFLKLAATISKMAIIWDLFFNCSTKKCVLLFGDKKEAELILESVDTNVNNYWPHKTLSTAVSQLDWENIFGSERDPLVTNIDNLPCKNENMDMDIEMEPEVIVVEIVDRHDSIETINLEDSDEEMDDQMNGELINDAINEVKNEEFRHFMKEISVDKVTASIRKLLVADLRGILIKYFPHVNTYLFDDGLERLHFMKTSSLFVSVDVNATENGRQDFSNVSTNILRKSKKIEEVINFSKLDKKFFAIKLCKRKRVSQTKHSLKFTHTKTNIKVECFFYMKMMQQKLKIVSSYIKCDPRVPYLIRFLVAWYEKCIHYIKDITDGQSGAESDFQTKFRLYYPFIQLIIFFLIHKGIVPTIDYFRKTNVQKQRIENHDVGISEDVSSVMRVFHQLCLYKPNNVDPVSKKPSAHCILTLAENFFKFYGEADLQNNIVSLPLGKLVNIESLHSNTFSENEDPNGLALAKAYENFEKDTQRTSFLIQDVCDSQLYEFSKDWSTASLSKFQGRCKDTTLEIKKCFRDSYSLNNLCHYFPITQPDNHAVS